ncbi:hypothetical protein WJX82_004973 [Trebouxia sp. C0006]
MMGEKILELLLTRLAELFGVVEAEIADMEHFEVTEQFEADTVARLRYLRNVHSLKATLEGLVGLTKLASLTNLSMRLSSTSPVGLDLWVQIFLKAWVCSLRSALP